MAITNISIQNRKPYAEKQEFDRYGAFELAEIDITYAVDPNQTANRRICDLDLAPLSDDGLVEFHGNAKLIYPTHTAPACLLVDVPNRGRPTVFSFNRPGLKELQATNTPSGDGFLCRHGFAVLSVGWQFDTDGMKLSVPAAVEEGQPICGEAICQMQPNRNTRSLLVGQGGVFTYEPSGEGRLFERPNTQVAYREIDPNTWRFGRMRDGTFDPTPTYISKDGGFSKGRVYTLVYETMGAPIVGLGLLAMRDAVTYFKYEHEWATGRPPFAIGYGASQTGRFLRHFLYEGLNEDEKERQVFDAVIPHIAGGQRGDFNHRFAQPGSLGIPSIGQRFPFATSTTTDSLSNQTEGLLSHCAKPPKILTTNTSWEYWRGDAALVHVSTDGERDITPQASERIYMFAGTHHINGVLPLTDRFALSGEQLEYPLNTISYTPLLKAVLLNALMWIRDGNAPPESQYPRLQDGSLVTRDEVLEQFKQSTRFHAVPKADSLTGLSYTDLGEETDRGICCHPAKLLAPYPRLVSAVDETLNEIAGVRLPEISIPIGIHSGWSPRHPDHGGSDQTATFAGFSVFTDERYLPKSRDACQALVTEATDHLISHRYVLAEDRDLVIENAMVRFDLAVSTLTATRSE